MRKPGSVKTLENLGRIRLSTNFFMRDFLYSEIANIHKISNIPDDPDLAVAVGKQLCEKLLEPLNATFGRIAIRSAFRSCEVNAFGNENNLGCASNEANYAGHIWDRRDNDKVAGAMACIVIPWFTDRYAAGASWTQMAYWIHDHLPYSAAEFFHGKGLCSFNLGWSECPKKSITSHLSPTVLLNDAHSAGPFPEHYEGFPPLVKGSAGPR